MFSLCVAERDEAFYDLQHGSDKLMILAIITITDFFLYPKIKADPLDIHSSGCSSTHFYVVGKLFCVVIHFSVLFFSLLWSSLQTATFNDDEKENLQPLS